MLIPITLPCLPVGGMPWNAALWVPQAFQRVAILSLRQSRPQP
jgi:hypothetical protein